MFFFFSEFHDKSREYIKIRRVGETQQIGRVGMSVNRLFHDQISDSLVLTGGGGGVGGRVRKLKEFETKVVGYWATCIL